MRFGHWRGVMFAAALFLSMAAGRMASADGFGHTMPREILARDLATGQPYMAPAIPWGHYAKSGIGDHFFPKGGLLGKLHSGAGCIGCGNGLFGGHGNSDGHGLFGGHGGKCGHGLFNHCGSGVGDGCGDPGCGGGHGKRLKNCGLCKGKGCGLCRSSGAGEPIHALASSQAPPAPTKIVMPAPQAAPMASSQCGDPGCNLGKGHHHGNNGMSMGDPCGSCGGRGCGLCHGLGRLFNHSGNACDSCGGTGCGKCGFLSKLCGGCGGKGCGMCGMGGLGSHLKGKLAGLLHHNKIKYFVGPGGPVPLTPGYTPYVVTTRSPRDFLAFPPYTPDGF
ncbi:hypothetical protein P12x_005040 [Tundrisphaera lichenicola]|uniref:hypothetical protein n=1 Tax=Tundrisphaera lichenicola TaxID=2029860 RepID=UPI003EB9F9D0